MTTSCSLACCNRSSAILRSRLFSSARLIRSLSTGSRNDLHHCHRSGLAPPDCASLPAGGAAKLAGSAASGVKYSGPTAHPAKAPASTTEQARRRALMHLFQTTGDNLGRARRIEFRSFGIRRVHSGLHARFVVTTRPAALWLPPTATTSSSFAPSAPTGARTIWIDVTSTRHRPVKTLADFAVCGEGLSPAATRMSTAVVGWESLSVSLGDSDAFASDLAGSRPSARGSIMMLLFGPRRCHLPRTPGRKRHTDFMFGIWFLQTVSGPPNACWRGRTRTPP